MLGSGLASLWRRRQAPPSTTRSRSAGLSQILPTVRTAARQYRGVARAIWGRVPTGLAYRMARLSGEVDAVTIREDDFRRYWEHIAVMDPDVFLQLLEAAGEHSAEDLLPDEMALFDEAAARRWEAAPD